MTIPVSTAADLALSSLIRIRRPTFDSHELDALSHPEIQPAIGEDSTLLGRAICCAIPHPQYRPHPLDELGGERGSRLNEDVRKPGLSAWSKLSSKGI